MAACVKSWNPEGTTPVIGVHGWLDNAGSFDKLVPLLPRSVNFVAIDLPGHGHSTHLPEGFSYDVYDMVTAIRRVVEYLDWKKLDLIGHSYGATISLFFSALFPEMVKKLVCFDQFNTGYSVNPGNLVAKKRKAVELRLTKPEDPYRVLKTKEDLVRILINWTGGKIERQSVETLLIRGSTEVGSSKFYLNRDWRLTANSAVFHLVESEHEWMNSQVRADVLLFKPDGGDVTRINFDVFRFKPVNARSYKEVSVEGWHHVHLDHPERVVEPLLEFLKFPSQSKYNSSSLIAA